MGTREKKKFVVPKFWLKFGPWVLFCVLRSKVSDWLVATVMSCRPAPKKPPARNLTPRVVAIKFQHHPSSLIMPGLRPKKSNQREQRPVMTVEFKSSVEEFSDAEEESSIAPAAGRDSDDSSHCFQDLVQAASPIPDTHQSPPCKDSRTKKKAKQHN